MEPSRTQHLREQLLKRREERGNCSSFGVSSQNIILAGADAIEEWGQKVSRQLCRAYQVKASLSNGTFVLGEGELFIGRFMPKQIFTPEEAEKRGQILEEYKNGRGQTGHCELDVTQLFAFGVKGLMDDIRSRSEKQDGEAAETLMSFAIALEGLYDLIKEASAVVENELERKDISQQTSDEWRQIYDSCQRLLQGAPKTFQDAVQLYWIMWLAVSFSDRAWAITLGHIDRWAYPFYQNDIEAGVLDRQKALEIIECLYLHLNEIATDGSAYPVMTGGMDSEGKEYSNELSVISMEALRNTNLVYPTVGIACNEKTSDKLFDTAVDLVANGYSTPAFFGDKVIQQGMQMYGVPEKDAWEYINSSCVEMTPVGASNVWVASPYFSLCQFLLEELESQKDAPVEDFDAFLKKYFGRLDVEITKGVEVQNEFRQTRHEYGRKPLQSVFTRDCIGRAKDIDDGGAVYNWVECSFVGLANLADSLYVIREEVFNTKRLSMAELVDILEHDFKGYENEHKLFLDVHPKYGQDNSSVDQLVDDVVTQCKQACAKHEIDPDNTHFVPGAFCWIMHERLGRECGATPDGRRKGFPFADGCGPAQGRECKGPTSAILSTTSWEHSALIGGSAMNMKFNNSSFAGEKGKANLGNLIKTFIQRGGFELQINVTDNNLLKEARKNPDAHRDLVVRIGGYTDYFTRLSPQMQEEVLLRYEYESV